MVDCVCKVESERERPWALCGLCAFLFQRIICNGDLQTGDYAEKSDDAFEPAAVEPGVLNFLDDCAQTQVFEVLTVSKCKTEISKSAQLLQVVKIWRCTIVQCSISICVNMCKYILHPYAISYICIYTRSFLEHVHVIRIYWYLQTG